MGMSAFRFLQSRRMSPVIRLFVVFFFIASFLVPWEHLPASFRERLGVLANLVNTLLLLNFVSSFLRWLRKGAREDDEDAQGRLPAIGDDHNDDDDDDD